MEERTPCQGFVLYAITLEFGLNTGHREVRCKICPVIVTT
jgi:hypothetical protein